MDRENFIEKVMRGEKVNLDDVAQNQAQRELKAIQTEAAQRLDDGRRRHTLIISRTSDVKLRCFVNSPAANSKYEESIIKFTRSFQKSSIS